MAKPSFLPDNVTKFRLGLVYSETDRRTKRYLTFFCHGEWQKKILDPEEIEAGVQYLTEEIGLKEEPVPTSGSSRTGGYQSQSRSQRRDDMRFARD